MKAEKATDRYGELAKYGAIEITTKKNATESHPAIIIRDYDSRLSHTNALIVIDGKISDNGLNTISPTEIQSIRVMKDGSAVEKYGEKGKDGVIEITTKNKSSGNGIMK